MVGPALNAIAPDAMLARIVMYQAVGQLLGGALLPYSRAFLQLVNERTPNDVLTPTELAALVERGYMDEGTAAAEAQKSGIDAARFHDLFNLQVQSPPPEWLAIALRRGIIPEDGGSGESVGFKQGIEQGPIGVKWMDAIRQMAIQLPSPEMALEALLEGQTTRADAEQKYAEWGGDPAFFELLYNTRGQAPTPLQAIEMVNRGVIPMDGQGPGVVSYEQAFLEGPWRNKWMEPFRRLAQYVPPPRTVTAMVRDGSLSDADALIYFKAQGMSEALAEAYLRSAHHTKTQSERMLSVSMLQTLYNDRLITRDDLRQSLSQLGYSDEDTEFIAEIVDWKRQATAVTTLVNKIHTLYVGHKIELATVNEAFARVGIVGEQQAAITELWNLERGANTKDLTQAQAVSAWKKGIIPADEATAILVQQGYSARDAWVLMSIAEGKALPGEPPREIPAGGN